MGIIFSSPESVEAIAEKEQTYADYLKAVEEAEQEAAQHEVEIKQEEENAKAIEEQLTIDAEALVQKRVEEELITQEQVIALKNAHAKLYRDTAAVLTELLFNRVNGISDSEDARAALLKFYKSYLSEDVFWMLTKMPIMLPLIWPTGEGDDKMHPGDQTTPATYVETVRSYIPLYITGKLPTLCQNASISNFVTLTADQLNNYKSLIATCDKFVNSAATYTDDIPFITACLKFVEDNFLNKDYHYYRALRATTKKGICETQIKLLPSTYPRNCVNYEFKEAIMMICNLCIERYGRCLNKNNLTTTNQSEIVTKGGVCFNIDNAVAKTVYETCLKPLHDACSTTLWDGKTYISASDITIKSEPAVKTRSVCNELETKTLDGKKYLKYINPTLKYIAKVFNTAAMEDTEQNPLSGISAQTVINLVDLVFDRIDSDTTLQKRNPRTINNADILTAFDFMIARPKKSLDYITDKDVSALSTLIYQIVIKENAQWAISIPLNNMHSSAQINWHMANTQNDVSLCPAYLTLRSANANEGINTNKNSTYKQITISGGSSKSSIVSNPEKIQSGYKEYV